ncbi:MAG TPA: beta-ketoacyl-ACP synthase [Ramlibacter sp.]|nr:beta-ketoacyl-ACP synthase [Ramlibacter sp.]
MSTDYLSPGRVASAPAATPALGILASTLVHPAGHGPAALWEAVAQGRTGLRANDLAGCDLPCWIGAVPGVDDPRLAAQLGPWDCRNHRLAWLALQDPAFHAAVAAARQRHGAHRVGLLLGTSTSGIGSTEQAYAQRKASGAWPADFAYRRTHAVDALCRFAAETLGVQGPMATLSTACSSSAKVFPLAQRWIACGVVDAVVVGGADSLCLSTLHGFNALQLLSPEICRPFDAGRKGISIGEAAGFMLVEARPAAVRVSGSGESSDAWHMSTPHPAGEGASAAMRMALGQAGLAPGDIGWVNAHGTATPANDRSEAAALAAVFGVAGVPVSSTKGVTGHALAAAGIVEAVITASAVEHGVLPPSANLHEPDPSLALDVVRELRGTPLRHAMSNNFGFGGSNCALVFSAGD